MIYGYIREDFDEYHGCWIPVLDSLCLYHQWYRRDREMDEKVAVAETWERYKKFKIEEK